MSRRNLRGQAEAILADLPEDATAADIAEALVAIGGICPLRHNKARGGDVAFHPVAGGVVAPDEWGEATSNPRRARSVIQGCHGCLIGVRSGDGRVVVDPATRRVRQPRTHLTLEQSAAGVKAPSKGSRRSAAEDKPLPQPLSIREAVAVVKTTLAEKVRLESELTARKRAVDVIEDRRGQAIRANAHARKRYGDEAADSVARGEEIPELPNVRKAIMKYEAEIAGCEAARPSAVEHLKVAQAALEEHRQRFVGAALDLDAALTSVALPPVLHCISQLADPLAELAAVSLIREQLLGPRFTLDRALHAPIGARQIAATFVERVPPALRIEALTVENIEARAEEIAAVRLAALESTTPKEN